MKLLITQLILLAVVFLVKIRARSNLTKFNCLVLEHKQLLKTQELKEIITFDLFSELAETISELLMIRNIKVENNEKYKAFINCHSLAQCLSIGQPIRFDKIT